MLTTNVTPATIAVALGVAAPSSGSITEERYQMWISDALMLIQSRLDDTDPAPTLDPVRLDYVVREAVAAHASSPENVTQTSVTVDDTTTQKSYKTSAGRVRILDDWWKMLGLASKGSGAFSFSPTRSCSAHLPWCNLAFGATYCSCGVDIADEPIFELG